MLDNTVEHLLHSVLLRMVDGSQSKHVMTENKSVIHPTTPPPHTMSVRAAHPPKLSFSCFERKANISVSRLLIDDTESLCGKISNAENLYTIMSGGRSTVKLLFGTEFVVRLAERGNRLLASDAFRHSYYLLEGIDEKAVFCPHTNTLASLNVPLACGEKDAVPFTLNRVVRGMHLADCYRTMDVNQRVRVLCAATEAIEMLHRQQMSHNDIHMGNIMVQHKKRGVIHVCLIDMDSVQKQNMPLVDCVNGRTHGCAKFDIYKLSNVFTTVLFEQSVQDVLKSDSFIPLTLADVSNLSLNSIKRKFIQNYLPLMTVAKRQRATFQ